MATENPTGGERAVPLSIPPEQTNWLRDRLIGFIADLERDVRTFADHPGTARWRDDADAYGRLAAGLDASEVVADDHVKRLVREWAEAHDGALHYERVVFEHDALLALREQIGAGR
jgi:hypothetical protein